MIPPITPRFLAGRIALVTGGSRGIGRAICLRLAAHGADVAIQYRQQEKQARAVEAAISASGSRAVAVRKELDGEPACRDLVATVTRDFGPIDILVNNAAVFTGAPIEDLDAAMWNETLNLNLSVPFYCIRACLPSMRKRGWGRIISVSSQAAALGSPGHAHYAAAKAGLLGLTFSVVRELGGHRQRGFAGPGGDGNAGPLSQDEASRVACPNPARPIRPGRGDRGNDRVPKF